MTPPTVRPAGAGATRTGSLLEASTAVPRTEVQVRNYDDRPYEVELVVRDGDAIVVERRYDLAPGEFRAERDVLDDGRYEVTVATGRKRDRTVCRVGDHPAETVCVEVGNHVVAASEGVY